MSGMKELLEQFKQIARNIVEADGPAEVVYGTMVGEGPTVRLSQKLTITGGQAVFPQPFVFYDPPEPEEGEDPTAAEWYQIEAGDTVILLKNRHGQRYVLLGKK